MDTVINKQLAFNARKRKVFTQSQSSSTWLQAGHSIRQNAQTPNQWCHMPCVLQDMCHI